MVVEAAQAEGDRAGPPGPLVHVPPQPRALEEHAVAGRDAKDRAPFQHLTRPEPAGGEDATAVSPRRGGVDGLTAGVRRAPSRRRGHRASISLIENHRSPSPPPSTTPAP